MVGDERARARGFPRDRARRSGSRRASRPAAPTTPRDAARRELAQEEGDRDRERAGDEEGDQRGNRRAVEDGQRAEEPSWRPTSCPVRNANPNVLIAGQVSVEDLPDDRTMQRRSRRATRQRDTQQSGLRASLGSRRRPRRELVAGTVLTGTATVTRRFSAGVPGRHRIVTTRSPHAPPTPGDPAALQFAAVRCTTVNTGKRRTSFDSEANHCGGCRRPGVTALTLTAWTSLAGARPSARSS